MYKNDEKKNMAGSDPRLRIYELDVWSVVACVYVYFSPRTQHVKKICSTKSSQAGFPGGGGGGGAHKERWSAYRLT